MKTKVLLFGDAVSLVYSILKLLSFVLNSPNVLDTLISVRRLFHNAAPLQEKLYEHNRYEVASSIITITISIPDGSFKSFEYYK